MSGSSSALALAAWLRALDDDALTALLHARPVRESGIRDRFDLAEALLEPASIQAVLAHLDRPTLAVLAAAGELSAGGGTPDAAAVAARLGVPASAVASPVDVLVRAALVDDTDGGVAPWGPVTDALTGWPQLGLPSVAELLEDDRPAALEPVAAADLAPVDRGAADRAFAAVTAVGELVDTLEREPARRLQRGGIALPDWRRMLSAASASADDELHALLDLAAGADLVQVDAGAWRATDEGLRWRGLPRVERWAALAEGWLAAVPPELREHFRRRARARWGDGLRDYLAWLYPAGDDWLPERLRAASRSAEQLGIVGDGVPSTPGAALLGEGADAAAAAVARLFPDDVRQVYIQHDLSVIAPGPLASDVDRRLRQFADVESVGVASSFRITAASVTRALTTGLTVEQLRGALSEVSLTGIPQPLEYLLTETAGRFGSLRVGALDGAIGTVEAGAHAYVRGDDPALVGQLAIDQALTTIGLRRVGEHRAVSRFDAETVYWSLVDARYPAVFEDAAGVIRAVARSTPVSAAASHPPDTAAILVARLRDADVEQPAEAGAAWNARQLELAIKAKLTVTVTVRMPDGTEVPYVLEPAALAGGRLRARDRRADIERTLPLSHIVAVAAAPSAG
ncbi:helicase-associated domain-containing protein [Protaetiibacter intestinalis]|uniref:Helicase XPB/Ssl2 N-terminal domain-containing protein n=1 Tax=Protaetiibacter intestinalis TaxID=2419774 RepID=A0A387B4P7_9MICO|nr:helicase-associated domain-containing protein [Protaetiibacter intestinalis]AYF97393.1 hypothetical protein D7I47_03425 [Protaetiibacter intestinalis]